MALFCLKIRNVFFSKHVYKNYLHVLIEPKWPNSGLVQARSVKPGLFDKFYNNCIYLVLKYEIFQMKCWQPTPEGILNKWIDQTN